MRIMISTFPLAVRFLSSVNNINSRFFATFHKTQQMYLVPLSDNAWRDYNGTLKLTSDITGGMKLTVEGMMGRTSGTNNNNAGNPGIFQTPEDIGARNESRVSYIDTRIFATDYWAPTYTDYYSLNAKLSHALSARTYYDASVSMFRSEYNTYPGRGEIKKRNICSAMNTMSMKLLLDSIHFRIRQVGGHPF